jgi:hypothetical protein
VEVDGVSILPLLEPLFLHLAKDGSEDARLQALMLKGTKASGDVIREYREMLGVELITREMCDIALDDDPSNFEHCPEALVDGPLALKAVRLRPGNLAEITPASAARMGREAYWEVVETACKAKPRMLAFALGHLVDNLAANGSEDQRLRNLMLPFLKQEPAQIRKLHDTLKRFDRLPLLTLEMCQVFVDHDPALLDCVPSWLSGQVKLRPAPEHE